jgi:Na+/pantothenate symporter
MSTKISAEEYYDKFAKDVSPALYRQLSAKYGLKYQQFITIVFGILAVSATNFITSTVFSLIIFSTAGLAGSISPVMFITILKIRTHYLVLSSTIFVGLLTAIAWRFLGYHQLINEALPAFLIALLFHEIFMRIRKQKIG